MKKFAVFIVLIFFLATGVFAQQKYALVIGNGNYTNISKLKNPVNDANDVAAALQSLGFTVDKVLDANLDQMENSIMKLRNRLSVSKNSYGFFFYAGHGVQSGGENYLIPIGANIPSESALRDRAINIQWALAELNNAGNELNVVVLDACRDNPFAWKRSGSRGLTVVANQPADSIIVYATSAGSTSADGNGRNGLFTSQLLNNLKTPGLAVEEVFKRTGADVARVSNREQIPAIYSQFFSTAYLGNKPQDAAEPVPAPMPTITPTPAPTTIPMIVQPSTPAPNGFVGIRGGIFTMGSPINEPDAGKDEFQHQVTVNSFYIGKYEVTQREYQEIMGKNPSRKTGSSLPVENVSWYDAIEYCNKRSLKEKLTPVYIISKNKDVRWNRNANGYRLPTEAEWEYACRAGTTTPFSTGNNITTNYANYNGGFPYNNNVKGEYRKGITPVGVFAPNAYGLYDMHGNVWEWCWDWYGSYYSDSQIDPIGEITGSKRVIRGGSWISVGKDLRSAKREVREPDDKNERIGFRVVRNVQSETIQVYQEIKYKKYDVEDESSEEIKNWLSFNVGGFAAGVSYERMLNSKLSLGTSIYCIFLPIRIGYTLPPPTDSITNDSGAGDYAFGIDAAFRFYPVETFFIGVALGYYNVKNSFIIYRETNTSSPFGKTLETERIVFTSSALGITPELGWKIDVGKKGGFFLQWGPALLFTFFKDNEGNSEWNAYLRFCFGIGSGR